MSVTRYAWFILALCLALPACGRKPEPPKPGGLSGDLVIFHAGSLSVPFAAVSNRFRELHPGVTVKAEAGGSLDTARKVSDLGRPCDVLGSADYRVIEDLLMPRYADFLVCFATNEMAIAFTDRSEARDDMTADNWPEVLQREGVTFGRADPNRDPCGYRTELVFALAERHYRMPGLAARLSGRFGLRYIRPKETDLLALLEAGEIDYLFIYRSVAEQHGLTFLGLPDEVNLSSPDHAAAYATAETRVAGAKPGETVTLTGEPIVYGVTIPRNAPNRAAAEAYVAFLLSEEGRGIMRSHGHGPIEPARFTPKGEAPEFLKPFVE